MIFIDHNFHFTTISEDVHKKSVTIRNDGVRRWRGSRGRSTQIPKSLDVERDFPRKIPFLERLFPEDSLDDLPEFVLGDSFVLEQFPEEDLQVFLGFEYQIDHLLDDFVHGIFLYDIDDLH